MTLAFSAEIGYKKRAIESVGSTPIALTNRWDDIDMADADNSAFAHRSDSDERWLPVHGYEGLYEVSDHGRVRSLKRIILRKGGNSAGPMRVRGRLLKLNRDTYGYYQASLCSQGIEATLLVHHLVLDAFSGLRPAGCECRHLDGDNSNNKLGNLVWGTKLENASDRILHGTQRTFRGQANGHSKLTERDVIEIRRMRQAGETYDSIAKAFSITGTNARSIALRETWAWL